MPRNATEYSVSKRFAAACASVGAFEYCAVGQACTRRGQPDMTVRAGVYTRPLFSST